MKALPTNWLLAGALAASLSLNARLSWGTARPAECTPEDAPCEVDCAALGLTLGQERELRAACSSQCAEAERLAARGAELLAELRRRLAEPDADAGELRALAGEVGATRTRSLEACVDSVLQVRALLDREQLEALLAACGSSCEKTD